MRASVFLIAMLLVGCASKGVTYVAGPTTRPAAGEETILSDIRQLTRGFSRAGEAYFSADMNWIIFQATPPGERQYQMYVARLLRKRGLIVGTEPPVRITPGNSASTCGYFSPDGKSLIFASTALKPDAEAPTTAPGYQRSGGTYRWDFPAGMEILRADYWSERATAIAKQTARARKRSGSSLELVTSLRLAPWGLTDNNAYDAECAYSPDGHWIVFASNRDGGDVELYVMRADGKDPLRLTRTKGYDGGPFVSPDGKRLVYRSDRAGNDLLQVFTADLVFDDSDNITGLANERQLTSGKDVNWAPYWHPDGKHIVYTTSRHGHQNYELYLMRADDGGAGGGGETRVTFHGGFDGLPVFSPDGKYLMWSAKRTSDNSTQVFIARFTLPKDG